MRTWGISESDRGNCRVPQYFHLETAPLYFRPAACRTAARACRRGIARSRSLIAEDNKAVGSGAFDSAPSSESDRKLLAAAANPIVVSPPDAAVAATVLKYLNGIGAGDGILRRSIKGACTSAAEANFQFGAFGHHFGFLL